MFRLNYNYKLIKDFATEFDGHKEINIERKRIRQTVLDQSG